MPTARGLTAPERPPIGTLFVDPLNGATFKLRDYAPSWTSEDPLATHPTYVVMLPGKSGFTNAKHLPASAVCVYIPEEDDDA